MYCIILTTTDNKETAEKLATGLVDQKLAACVQIDEVLSFFRWEGKASAEKEYRIMIKTRAENYSKIEQFIQSQHNYTLPQIIKLDITGGMAKYFKWMDEAMS